jgi:DNA-binding LytR/AlgR family response regulator
MKNYQVVIVEDELPSLEMLSDMIGKIPRFEVVGAFEKPKDALVYMYSNSTDLLVTDVNLPETSGFWLAARAMEKEIPVIVVSGQWDTAWMSFEVNAIDFVPKPFSFPRVNMAMEKFLKMKEVTDSSEGTQNLMIKNLKTNSVVTIPQDRIVYMKGSKDYAEIYYEDIYVPNKVEREFCRITMQGFLEKVNRSVFIQVHKSYIINKNRVIRYEYTRLHLFPNVEIPIGETFKKELYEYYNKGAV